MGSVQERRVRLVFSHDAMLRLYERAHRLEIDRGGRFEPLDGGIVLWSASPERDPERAEPTSAFCVAWAPAPIIWKLQWAEAAGGSEEEVRRAIAFLAGPDQYHEDDDGGPSVRVPSPRRPPPQVRSSQETA